MSSLLLSSRREDGRAVLALDGELDLATVTRLREAGFAALDTAHCTTLVLDLEKLTFVDSTGIGCWIELRNRAEDAGRRLELVSIPPGAKRTLTIAGLLTVFGLEV